MKKKYPKLGDPLPVATARNKDQPMSRRAADAIQKPERGFLIG